MKGGSLFLVLLRFAYHELNEYSMKFYDLVRDQLHGAGYGL